MFNKLRFFNIFGIVGKKPTTKSAKSTAAQAYNNTLQYPCG